MKNTLRSLATASALVLMATSGALAEWKPSGPITMLIGFAAGGGADTQARMIAEGWEQRDYTRNEWGLLPTRAGVELSLQTVRTRTMKLTKDMISGAGEMYDLAADPHEMTNLFDDPAHAKTRQTLEALIDQRPDDMLQVQKQVGMA